VPDGLVLTTEALADALGGDGLDDGARQTEIEAMLLPPDSMDALATAVERL
jgi:hypothetical protein